MLLQLFNEVLLKCDVELSNSFYKAKKTIWDLGLDYKKIDACVNDCMLYWKENSKKKKGLVCGVLRWKSGKKNVSGKKVPHKILRYFPITPRP